MRNCTVTDFVYETVPSNAQILIYDGTISHRGEVLFKGTPDDLFDDYKHLVEDFRDRYILEVSAENNILTIGCFQR